MSVSTSNVNSPESLIIEYMKQKERDVKMSEISANTGLSIALTLRTLRKLINCKVVIPLGDAKYGKYRLV